MNWLNLISLAMSLLCVPSIVLATYRFLYKRVKDNDERTKATQLGVQALLRANMISEYNKALDKGYAEIYAKQNFENVWTHYHALGVNGVMDEIREKYMTLPERKTNDD